MPRALSGELIRPTIARQRRFTTPRPVSGSTRGGLLTVPEGAIGLRQSDALFQHTVRLHEKSRLCRREEVRAIGVSTRPARWKARICRVFWQERGVARSAAHFTSVPLFTVPISRDISRQQRCRRKSSTCLTADSWRGTCPAARVSCCM